MKTNIYTKYPFNASFQLTCLWLIHDFTVLVKSTNYNLSRTICI